APTSISACSRSKTRSRLRLRRRVRRSTSLSRSGLMHPPKLIGANYTYARRRGRQLTGVAGRSLTRCRPLGLRSVVARWTSDRLHSFELRERLGEHLSFGLVRHWFPRPGPEKGVRGDGCLDASEIEVHHVRLVADDDAVIDASGDDLATIDLVYAQR